MTVISPLMKSLISEGIIFTRPLSSGHNNEQANSITEDENSFYIMVITTIPEIHVNNHFTRKINETHFAFCVSHFAK